MAYASESLCKASNNTSQVPSPVVLFCKRCALCRCECKTILPEAWSVSAAQLTGSCVEESVSSQQQQLAKCIPLPCCSASPVPFAGVSARQARSADAAHLTGAQSMTVRTEVALRRLYSKLKRSLGSVRRRLYILSYPVSSSLSS